jgi:hypothetical protein
VTVSSSNQELIADIIRYLMPSALSGDEPKWPPDAFAIASTILKRGGAYREVANAWPPNGYKNTDDWHTFVTAISEEWRNACEQNSPWPVQVEEWWNTVIASSRVATNRIASDQNLLHALVGIVAASDQACHGLGFNSANKESPILADRATRNLSTRDTLCEQIDPSRTRVMPKAHNPVSGMTIRSLTHNLALWDRLEVTPSWDNVTLSAVKKEINLLLLPWPLKITPRAFKQASNRYGLHLPERVDLFEYSIPFQDVDVERIEMLLQVARQNVGNIHMVVLPELSMSSAQFKLLQKKVQLELEVPLLIAGIGGANIGKLGSNKVAISIDAESEPLTQSKHHRWRIDFEQAKTYGIGHCLPKRKDYGAWWEAIHIEERVCRFFNANDWMTFCVLICEDLARQDPLSEMVRSVGPNLVIALLLDGPQIADRWPAHYATVLADDPRSSVLTLTSAGMVDLSRSQFGGGPRSVGLWKDAISRKNQQLVLEPNSEALVLKLKEETREEWTVDGRNDGGKTDYLRLGGIYQIAYPVAG